MSSARRVLSLLATLLLLASVALGLEPAGQVQGETCWRGEVLLRQAVRVEPAAVLTIAPGTVIRPQSPQAKLIVAGILKVQGTANEPVTFAAPAGWEGIEFVEAPPGSSFDHAVFSRAAIAVSSVATGFTLRHCTFRDGGTAVKLLREASPVIEENLFAGNEIGIDSEMKSVALIRRNRFSGHRNTAILVSHNSVGAIEGNTFENNKQGVGVLQKYPDRIGGNLFRGNEVGIYCNQTQDTPQISGNTFEGNRLAVANVSFSYPEVADNLFTGNDIAIRNDQFGSPRIVRNLFRGNKTAVYNYRKSNPVIENNLIEQNELALFCDYSSYPMVHRNNFRQNAMGVRLGIYQSGDWEKRFGSKAIVQKEAAARNGRSPLLAHSASDISDVVDVSNNWWGDDTAKLKRAGVDGNLEMFHDRRDQPQVVYEGFGPGSYALDLIRYAPWLTAPVADSGPAKQAGPDR